VTNNTQPTLGILECGQFSDEMTSVHGTYTNLYAALLGEASFNYRSFAVHTGDLPSSIDDADAWLISGSRHAAYEEHPWIPPLEEHLRNAYAAKQPIIGICFGHQILAKALGGTVEKFSGGWQMGQYQYELSGPYAGVSDKETQLLAFHQDQITQLPPEGKVVGQTEHCQYAAVQYQNHALSLQPHPEFTDALVENLLQERGHLFPAHNVSSARESLGGTLENESTGTAIRQFILQALA